MAVLLVADRPAGSSARPSDGLNHSTSLSLAARHSRVLKQSDKNLRSTFNGRPHEMRTSAAGMNECWLDGKVATRRPCYRRGENAQAGNGDREFHAQGWQDGLSERPRIPCCVIHRRGIVQWRQGNAYSDVRSAARQTPRSPAQRSCSASLSVSRHTLTVGLLPMRFQRKGGETCVTGFQRTTKAGLRPDHLKSSLRRFFEVGNGKETPENMPIECFYTTSARSGPSGRSFYINFRQRGVE
jgi:hypothetical protein